MIFLNNRTPSRHINTHATMSFDMQNVHDKFLSEAANYKIAYTMLYYAYTMLYYCYHGICTHTHELKL